MCNYFSVGITKTSIEAKAESKVISLRKGNVKAFYLHTTSSHNEIFEATNITGKFDADDVNPEFVRVEIEPKDKSKITRNPEDWALKIDQNEKTVPAWYVENKLDADDLAWNAWKQSVAKQVILVGEVVEEVTDIQIAFLTGKIEKLSGSAQITDMSGSAQITDMSGSAQIIDMRDSAQITYMRGSAQIIDMRDSAQITYMRDSAQIIDMRDSAQITYMSDSAQITYMSDSAQITYMSGSAQITDMSDSAQIKQLTEYAKATKETILYISKTVKTKRVTKKGII